MNLEKLKPWNWFKHENHSTSQIPVTKKEAASGSTDLVTREHQAVDSFLKLHNEMDRLFSEAWRSFGLADSRFPSLAEFNNNALFNNLGSSFNAKLDIAGNDKEYEVTIDLPGLTEKDINIELDGTILTIKGQKEEKSESEDKQYYRVERTVGAFERTLSLPDDADGDNISAKMKHGVLHITIPRKALPKDDIKRIEISS